MKDYRIKLSIEPYEGNLRETLNCFNFEEAEVVVEHLAKMLQVYGSLCKVARDKDHLKHCFEELCAREGIDKTWNLTIDQFIEELMNIARGENK